MAVTPLQQLLTTRLAELDLSYRAAAERSGGLVSHSTLNFLVHGQMRAEGLQTKTLQGISLALDLPLSQVEQAVKASCGRVPTEFKLPKKADKLSPAQRKAVLAFVNALLESKSP